MMHLYEKKGIEIDFNLISQYLQNKQIAENFATYYVLFQTYKSDYQIDAILNGKAPAFIKERAISADNHERIALLEILFDGVSNVLSKIMFKEECLADYMSFLKIFKSQCGDPQFSIEQHFDEMIEVLYKKLEKEKVAGTLTDIKLKKTQWLIWAIEALKISTHNCGSGLEAWKIVKKSFDQEVKEHSANATKAKEQLDHAFDFVNEVYSEGQEMSIFVTEITVSQACAKFISRYGSESYYKFNKALLIFERQKNVLNEIENLNLEDI